MELNTCSTVAEEMVGLLLAHGADPKNGLERLREEVARGEQSAEKNSETDQQRLDTYQRLVELMSDVRRVQ